MLFRTIAFTVGLALAAATTAPAFAAKDHGTKSASHDKNDRGKNDRSKNDRSKHDRTDRQDHGKRHR